MEKLVERESAARTPLVAAPALAVQFFLIPLIVGQAIDENWTEVSWSKLTVSALKVLGASVVSGIFLFLQRRMLIGISRNIEYDLRQDFYAH